MNELHKAYAILGLDAGSSMDSVLRRYKRLIMVWHPDRAPTPEHKEFAEEELKKINNAKDVLAKHFGAGGAHKGSGCECQPNAETTANTAGAGARTGPGPGPAYNRAKTADDRAKEEEAAAQRDRERRAREAAEEAARREQQRGTQTQTQTMESAMQQQRALQDEQLRWKISIGLVIAFIALEFFGAGAINAKNWWHDMTRKWQNQSTNNTPAPPSSTTGSTTVSPYIAPYEQTPGGNPSSWAAEKAQADKERSEREQKQHDQDIYFARLEIDKYQKIIEHCNSELTNLEIQIASPSVSDYEKNKLRDTRDFRQKNLAEAQENLKYAQNKLAELTGQPVQDTTSQTLYQSPFSGSQTQKLFPSTTTNTSPFAAPAAPNTLFPSSGNGLSKPLSTSPSFSELLNKSSSPSNTRFSDLLKTPQSSSSGSN